MKSTITLLALVLATALPASAAKVFEGVVHYTVSAGKQTSTMQYAIKGERLRMEMESRNAQMIGLYETSSGVMHILMPAQRMYMTYEGARELAQQEAAREATIEATGRTAEIAGHTCTEYVITDKKQVHEIWTTREIGRYIAFGDAQGNQGRNSAWAQLLVDRGEFPLRMVTKDKKGKVISTMEATKVESRRLETSLFEIPEGYQKFSIPGLGGLMRGRGEKK